MSVKTADICDVYTEKLTCTEPIFKNYGKIKSFSGAIVTIKVFEDNTLVRKTLEESGHGRVLVIDGGGSTRCALVGDNIAALAHKNGWAGVLVYGCIRDSEDIAHIDIGLQAIGTCPVKSIKRGEGQENLSVSFAGATFRPGGYIYADQDGVLVSDTKLI